MMVLFLDDSRHWHLSLGQDYARAKELPVVSCHLLRELRTSHSYSLGSAFVFNV